MISFFIRTSAPNATPKDHTPIWRFRNRLQKRKQCFEQRSTRRNGEHSPYYTGFQWFQVTNSQWQATKLPTTKKQTDSKSFLVSLPNIEMFEKFHCFWNFQVSTKPKKKQWTICSLRQRTLQKCLYMEPSRHEALPFCYQREKLPIASPGYATSNAKGRWKFGTKTRCRPRDDEFFVTFSFCF